MDPFDDTFWNLCQAAVWVEFREKDLVRKFNEADRDAYRALHFYPRMWPSSRKKTGSILDLQKRLTNGDLKAEGYSRTDPHSIFAIPQSAWIDIDLRPPLALDTRPGHRDEELWTRVRVRSAEVQKLWRSLHEVSGRTKYDWIELRQIHDNAKARNPRFSKRALVEEIQLEFKERHRSSPPGRSTLQNRMKTWD